MDDQTLRIRVDVETATLGQLRAALKQVRTELDGAARQDVPALRQEMSAIQGAMRQVSGSGESLTQTVRGARQEARLMRFALVELMHGFDGVAVAIGGMTGASADTKKSMKAITTELQDSLNAGLGTKFALDLMGGSFAKLATPIA